MCENMFPPKIIEGINRRKQLSRKILEMFEAEKLNISDCQMTLDETKSMLKECRILLEKPATEEPLQAKE